MYNYDQYTDLIKKLRQLSRLGQTMPEDAGQTAADQAAAQAKKTLDDLTKQFERGTSMADLYSKQLNILNSNFGDLQHGLSVVTLAQETYNSSIVKMVQEATFFDEIESNIARTLKITTAESYKQTQAYGTFLETLNTTRESLDKYRTTLNGILPGQSANIAQSKEYATVLLASQQHLQDFQGLTANAAASYTLYTEGSGKNIAQQLSATAMLADQWETATGLTGQYNTILTEISSLTADIRSEYSRTNGELELAVLKSKRLGMTISQLDKVGSHLLNIEESVGKEIEFQLISGKRLVDAQGRSLTNKFREAKLSGDSNKLAEAMTDIVTEQGDIISGNNFMAKQALADTLGMSVQELVVAKQRYDLGKKLAAVSGKTEKEISELTPEQAKEFKAALQHKVTIAKTPEAEDEAKKNLKLLADLNEANKNLETPAEKSERHLQSIVDNGIFMKMPKTTKTNEKGETTTTYVERKTFDPTELIKTIKDSKTTAIAQNEGFLKLVGTTQTLAKLVAADKTYLTELSAIMPGLSILSTAATSLAETIKTSFPLLTKALNLVTGALPAGKEGKAVNIGRKGKGQSLNEPVVPEVVHDLSIDANGGPIVMSLKENRIFQGTKNDDVAMYPGAVDVATENSTTKNSNVSNRSVNVNYNKIETIVESQIKKLSIKPVVNVNMESNRNNMDSINYNKIENTMRTAVQSEIGKLNTKPTVNVNTDKNTSYNENLEKITRIFQTAVSKLKSEPDTNAIVSAIKTAFADVQISVHVDPVKIDKEIKFRNTRINR